MIISDLNYLEAVEGNGVVGGDFDFNYSLESDTYVTFIECVDIDKYIKVDVCIDGNLAMAEASANAYGSNTLTESFALTYTDDCSSHSASYAVSATK